MPESESPVAVEIRYLRETLEKSEAGLRERIGELKAEIVELKKQITSVERHDEILREPPFDKPNRDKLIRVLGTFEDDTEARQQFVRSVKTSVVTLILSIMAFSLIVPLLQHLLLGK